MTKKISVRKALIFLALMFILPFMVSANGVQEADNGRSVNLGSEVTVLLEKVQSGELTLDEARMELISLEKEYQVTNEEDNKIRAMLNDVSSGLRTADQCRDQLQEMTRTRQMTQEKIKTGDASGEQIKVQDRVHEKMGPGSSSSAGDGSSVSSTGKK